MWDLLFLFPLRAAESRRGLSEEPLGTLAFRLEVRARLPELRLSFKSALNYSSTIFIESSIESDEIHSVGIFAKYSMLRIPSISKSD